MERRHFAPKPPSTAEKEKGDAVEARRSLPLRQRWTGIVIDSLLFLYHMRLNWKKGWGGGGDCGDDCNPLSVGAPGAEQTEEEELAQALKAL